MNLYKRKPKAALKIAAMKALLNFFAIKVCLSDKNIHHGISVIAWVKQLQMQLVIQLGKNPAQKPKNTIFTSFDVPNINDYYKKP